MSEQERETVTPQIWKVTKVTKTPRKNGVLRQFFALFRPQKQQEETTTILVIEFVTRLDGFLFLVLEGILDIQQDTEELRLRKVFFTNEGLGAYPMPGWE